MLHVSRSAISTFPSAAGVVVRPCVSQGRPPIGLGPWTPPLVTIDDLVTVLVEEPGSNIELVQETNGE